MRVTSRGVLTCRGHPTRGFQMPPEANAIGSASLGDKVRALTAKARLLTLSHLDRRTAAYRRTAELISSLEADLGGDPSTAQRALIQRAAVVAALLEDIETRFLAG